MTRKMYPESGGSPGFADGLGKRVFLWLILAVAPFVQAGESPGVASMQGMNMRDMDMSDMPAGNAAAGKRLAQSKCAACHGADGLSDSSDYPLLAGQDEMYLCSTLGAYRSGARQSSVMMQVTMPLSDQDLADLAAHFASSPYKRVGVNR